MSNDCLVTKLKGVVDNDDLRKFNCITLKTHELEGNPGIYETRTLTFGTTDEPVTINIIGDGFLGETEGQQTLKTFTIPANVNNKLVFFSNGTYKIEIFGQYSLTKFSFVSPTGRTYKEYPGFFELDVNSLEYTPLTVFRCGGSYISGNANNIAKNSPAITDFSLTASYYDGDINDVIKKVTNTVRLYGAKNVILDISNINSSVTNINMFRAETVTGDIVTLGRLKNITDCNMYYSKVSGSIESMVEAMCSGVDARTEGTFNFTGSEYTTLNNVVRGSAKIEFNSTGAVLKDMTNNNVIATYNNGNWTYA